MAFLESLSLQLDIFEFSIFCLLQGPVCAVAKIKGEFLLLPRASLPLCGLCIVASSMVEVATGKFGFVGLLSGGSVEELECFVAAQDEQWSIILVPASKGRSASDASWSSPGASALRQEDHASEVEDHALTLQSKGGIGVRVKKVEIASVRTMPQSKNVSVRFEPSRPKAADLLACYYQSEVMKEDVTAKLQATSTDDGGTSKRGLERENARLARELAALKATQAGKRAGGKPSDIEEHQIGSESGEDSEESMLPEDREVMADDGLVSELRKFAYDSEARGSSDAPRSQLNTAREVDPDGRRSRKPSGEAERREKGRRVGERESARGAGRRRGSEETRVQLEMQREIIKMMQEFRTGGYRPADDAPAGNELDGLRVARNLSRMRTLKEQLEAHPDRNYREYKDRWVRQLGAENRPFRWVDRNRWIRWKKYSSIRRMDWMLCHVLETLEQGNSPLAMGQVVQCMKCLHEFSNHGSWRTSWPMTHMVDPLESHVHGGTEIETETTLAWLRTQDDLRKKVMAGGKVDELVSDEEERDGKAPFPKKNPKKHPKKEGE